ncbi:hypothetical protein BDY21DRAFT_421770, partial [Lineolata rhizophorae]
VAAGCLRRAARLVPTAAALARVAAAAGGQHVPRRAGAPQLAPAAPARCRRSAARSAPAKSRSSLARRAGQAGLRAFSFAAELVAHRSGCQRSLPARLQPEPAPTAVLNRVLACISRPCPVPLFPFRSWLLLVLLSSFTLRPPPRCASLPARARTPPPTAPSPPVARC